MLRPEFPNAQVSSYPPARTTFTSFRDLFGQLTVVKILDDFESAKTRQEARQLAINRPFFATMGVALVAISEQPQGSAAFLESSGWKDGLYLDLYRNVCRSASSKSQTRLGAAILKFVPRTTFQVGGTYIVTPNLRILYAHKPRGEDSPSVAGILNICYNIVTPSSRSIFSFGRAGEEDTNYSSNDDSFPRTV